MKLKHEEEIKSTLGFSLAHTGPEKMFSPVSEGGGLLPMLGDGAVPKPASFHPQKSVR